MFCEFKGPKKLSFLKIRKLTELSAKEAILVNVSELSQP